MGSPSCAGLTLQTSSLTKATSFPAQGHVIPFMELALCLVNHGIPVTFVNTLFNHQRILQSLSDAKILVPELLHLVSIPDGLESDEDRNDLGKLMISILRFMPEKLEALISDINIINNNDDKKKKITCVIADENMGWALDVAEKMGIRTRILFWPASAAVLALAFNFQRLIDDGIIDTTGALLKNNNTKILVQLSPGMPAMDPEEFAWIRIGDENMHKIVFDFMEKNNRRVKKADYVICNTSEALEEATLNSFPEILPIGPLLSTNRLGKTLGSFWSEDSDCLSWLDKQPPQSVIYVAFGSFTVFDRAQFQELAMALQLSNKPFLWVVRPDLISDDDDDDDDDDEEKQNDDNNNAYPKPTGFRNRNRNRVIGRGRLASWAPQQDVLNHPSLACFVSHCGWNSTMEGISNGMPFLCWPYFADQFLNRSYICDVWKVGLGFKRNENGIIERGEIKNKIDELLGDESFRARAMELKSRILDNLKEGGSSSKNLVNVINWIKHNN